VIFTETPLAGSFVIEPEPARDSGVSSHVFSSPKFQELSDCSSPACHLPFHSGGRGSPVLDG